MSHIIDWVDPVDNTLKFLAVSEDTGHYWTENPDDPLILDTEDLEVKHTIEDTINQIASKYSFRGPGDGKQYERHNLFRHPDPKIHAWLAVEKRPNGTRDPDTNKVNRSYQAYWTHKFKLVTCISKLTGRCQGNPKMNDKDYARKNSAKAKEQRKRRLANAQETAKKLHFDPLQRLALYAMGDSDRLGLNEDVKQSIQMKALETFLKYSHQQMKSYSPQEMERLKGESSGPKINIILPADGSEDKKHVIEHKSEDELENFLSSGKIAYGEIEEELEVHDEKFSNSTAHLELPDEEDGQL